MQQSDGTNTLKFSYAPDGKALGVIFNGTSYYYIYNLQGDVIGLYDSSGNVVVKYTYDSWGKLLDTTGSLASTLGYYNPIRYRGYIYDEEIGFYLLHTRYYDPEIGRFINADGYVSTGQDLTGYNMFTYCANNAVLYVDITGTIYTIGTSISDGVGYNYEASKVGTATYISVVPNSYEGIDFFFGIEDGDSYTLSIDSTDDADVIFFYQATNEGNAFFDNKIGMNCNIKEGGFRVSGWVSSYSVAACFNNTSYELAVSPDKCSFTIAYDVDYKNLTASHYTQFFVRPVQTSAAIATVTIGTCALYYTIQSAIASLFVVGGAVALAPI